MKRKDFLLLTFLLSQTAPVWAMDPNEKFDDSNNSIVSTRSKTKKSQDSALQVQQIKKGILKAQREMAKVPAELLQGEKVFLLGTAGAGKSTLLNFLVGKKIDVDDCGRLDTSDPVKGSEIGHGEISKTISPSLCLGPNDMVLIDFPGLEDTGGPEIDLIHACVGNKWFTGRLKILLAVDEADLRLRTGPFLSLMNNLTKTIPIEQLKESLALVVTKQGSVKFANPHQKLKDIIRGNGAHHLTQDVKTLLLHLTDGDNIHVRVPFFPCPDALECEYDSQASKDKILESIRSLKPMVNPKVQMQLFPESKLLVSELGNGLNKDITKSIKTVLKPRIVQLCEHYTTDYENDDNMADLENSLKATELALELLETDSEESLMGFANSLDFFFGQDENSIKERVKTLSFLKELTNEVTASKDTWSRALQSIITQIHESIDTVAQKIGNLISLYLEQDISSQINRFCSTIIEFKPSDEDAKLQFLTEGLKAIREALNHLYHGHENAMTEFAHSFNTFFENPEDNPLVGPIETVNFLQTLKEGIDYPTEEYGKTLQPLLLHIQSLVGQQEKVLKKAKKRATQETAHREMMDLFKKQIEENAKAQAEKILRLKEELANVQQAYEIAEADREAYLDELDKRGQEVAGRDDIIRDLEARVEKDLEITEQQLAESEQEAQTLRQQLNQANQSTQGLVQQLATQKAETQRLQAETLANKNEIARKRILSNTRPNTILTLGQYNLLLPNERKMENVVKIVNGKNVITPVYRRK